MGTRGVVGLIAAGLAACGSPGPGVPDAGGPDVSVPDASANDAPVEAPDTCADGVKDGAETDVDCGGSCAPCADGHGCVVATDCASNRCSAGTCGLRAWFTQSNGTDVAIPASQTWVDGSFSGLLLTPTLYAPSLVFLRWTGTLRYGGGGNGICQVGQRFVIDDVPTGNPTWGNAIMDQNGATRVHESFTTEMAVPLGVGIHKIAVEMDDAQNYASCNLDGDGGLAYDRSRLAAAAYDPNSAWYAESTAEVSSINSSTFVDIPGVSVSFNLAADRHVQASMTGTQLAQGVTPGTGNGNCAYRLVIDGTPLGDTTYGQAIAIGDVAKGWWAPVALAYGQDMAAGAHTISAQMSNTSGNATCYAGQGNNDYARFRIFVSATPKGGPSTSVESTGGPNVLGSLSAWTAIGLSTTFDVTSPTPAQLEVAATERTMSGSGQCAWRFVIDGSPLGDVNYGQAINMGAAATWWTATPLLWGQTFGAGTHTVSVEVRNAGSSGDCGANGDALPYGRARLLVRVP